MSHQTCSKVAAKMHQSRGKIYRRLATNLHQIRGKVATRLQQLSNKLHGINCLNIEFVNVVLG
jgi:hypothetical protein